jgi:mono/diheme cytochrome c family protein
MNQIKYILSACLILLMIFMGIFLFKTFSDSGIITQTPTLVDNVSSLSSEVNSKGEQLFKQNCASCHALDRDLTGPALNGVSERGPWAKDKSNLKKWIKNPAPFIANDTYVKALKDKFGLSMPSQAHLSDAEIEEVIGYISR